jgi:MATE family multidrug resistance protein
MIERIKRHFDGEGGITMMLTIAVPMIVSNGAESVMLFIDRLFLSRLGREHLAAAMSGGLTVFMLMTLFLGVIGYVTALVAQYYGAERKSLCAVGSSQGILLAVASYPIVLLAMPLGRLLLNQSGHDPLQHELEVIYFSILGWGSIFGLLRAALAGFFCGIGRTRMVMIANVIGMIVNVIMNYILIFGHFGFPALGMRGAAYGTIIGSSVVFVIMAAAYLRPSIQREFNTLRGFCYSQKVFKTLLKFGLPGGVEFLMNMAAFTFFVQIFHSYGRDEAAAITITFNWDLIAFLPLIGFNLAVMSMVGRYMGAKDPDTAQRAAFSGLKVASIYAAIMGSLFLFVPHQLVSVFASGEMADEYSNVLPLAVTTLRLAALYTFADAVLLVFDGALRGAGDTKWTMKMSVFLHWLMTVIAYVLIKILHVRPALAWFSFTILVLALAVALGLRFLSGHWRTIQVIEPGAEPVPAPVGTASVPPDVVR